MVKTAKIFDIQRFCLFDGDGIRTTVFFKGCPLQCRWCCNPESQSFSPELLVKLNRGCNDCRKCTEVCDAITVTEKGVSLDREKCTACGKCESICAFDRLKTAGRDYTAEELLEIIMKDKDYYDRSGGGVTLSGGEVCAQAEFAAELADMLKARGIGVMAETCGYANEDAFVKVASRVDRLYFDVKLVDGEEHKRFTGKGNDLIKKNLRLATELTSVVVRVPLIVGVNANEKFMRELGELLAPLRVERVELLPYHRLGAAKYSELGREYSMRSVTPPTPEQMTGFLREFEKYLSIPVRIR